MNLKPTVENNKQVTACFNSSLCKTHFQKKKRENCVFLGNVGNNKKRVRCGHPNNFLLNRSNILIKRAQLTGYAHP